MSCCSIRQFLGNWTGRWCAVVVDEQGVAVTLNPVVQSSSIGDGQMSSHVTFLTHEDEADVGFALRWFLRLLREAPLTCLPHEAGQA